MKKVLLLIVCTFLFTGCIKEVKPWQKATLAKQTMQDGGINKNLKRLEVHIYVSKEGTRAGQGIAGGGCGCN